MQDDAATLADGNHSRSSESLFRAIFEAAPVGMAEVASDAQHVVLGADGFQLAGFGAQLPAHQAGEIQHLRQAEGDRPRPGQPAGTAPRDPVRLPRRPPRCRRCWRRTPTCAQR